MGAYVVSASITSANLRRSIRGFDYRKAFSSRQCLPHALMPVWLREAVRQPTGGPVTLTDVKLQLIQQPYADSSNLSEFLADILRHPTTTELTIVVAWAKRSGLGSLTPALTALRSRGGRTCIVLGIDQGGASSQGLRLAMELFGNAYVFHEPTGGTFHPKLYWAKQGPSARLFLGSNNLTEGGLRSNYELAVSCSLDMSQPNDVALAHEVDAYLGRLVNDADVCVRLDERSLDTIVSDPRFLIANEDQPLFPNSRPTVTAQPGGTRSGTALFGRSRERKKARVHTRVKAPAQAVRWHPVPPGRHVSMVATATARTAPVPEAVRSVLQRLAEAKPLELLTFRARADDRSDRHTDVLAVLRNERQRAEFDSILEPYAFMGAVQIDGNALQVLAFTEAELTRQVIAGETVLRDALQDGVRVYPGDGVIAYLPVADRWTPERAAARWMAVAERQATTIRTKREQLPASHPLARYYVGELSPPGIVRTARESIVCSAFALGYIRGGEPEGLTSLEGVLQLAAVTTDADDLRLGASLGEDEEAELATVVSEAERWAEEARRALAMANVAPRPMGFRAIEAYLSRVRLLLPNDDATRAEDGAQ
jgi:HKD family nuclease